MVRWFPLLGLTIACQRAPLSEPLDPTDPLLASLPADAPLLVGGSMLPFIAAAEQLDALPLGADLLEAESLAGACTSDGCALAATGALSRVPALSVLSSRAARPLADGVELVADDGLALQARWSGDQLRVGHAAAVEGFDDGPRLDPATLVGAIPDGDLWVYARDQDALFAQASEWLSGRDTQAADEALADLQRALASKPALAEEIDAIALSLVADTHPEVRLWLHCADTSGAQQVLLALHAARAVNASQQPDPRIAAALGDVVFTRSGSVVEAAFVDVDGLAMSILEESR